jgi:hypothetical protein
VSVRVPHRSRQWLGGFDEYAAGAGTAYSRWSRGVDPSLIDPRAALIGGLLQGYSTARAWQMERERAEAEAAERARQAARQAQADQLAAERAARDAETHRAQMRQRALEFYRAGGREGKALGDGSGADVTMDIGALLTRGAGGGQPVTIPGRYRQIDDDTYADLYQTPESIKQRRTVQEETDKSISAMQERERRNELFRRVRSGDRDAAAELYASGASSAEVDRILRMDERRDSGRNSDTDATTKPISRPTDLKQRATMFLDDAISQMSEDQLLALTHGDLANRVLTNPALWEGVDPKQGMPQLLRIVRGEAVRAAAAARARVMQERARQQPTRRTISNR